MDSKLRLLVAARIQTRPRFQREPDLAFGAAGARSGARGRELPGRTRRAPAKARGRRVLAARAVRAHARGRRRIRALSQNNYARQCKPSSAGNK